jgi:hypothetical protein
MSRALDSGPIGIVCSEDEKPGTHCKKWNWVLIASSLNYQKADENGVLLSRRKNAPKVSLTTRSDEIRRKSDISADFN